MILNVVIIDMIFKKKLSLFDFILNIFFNKFVFVFS